jgi:hypothetical protein
VGDRLQTLWDEKEGFMSETTIAHVAEGHSGYGSAPLAASVYNFGPSLGGDVPTVLTPRSV